MASSTEPTGRKAPGEAAPFLPGAGWQEAVVERAVEAMLTVDDGGLIRSFNGSAERLFGCTAEQVLGTPLERFIPERFRAGHPKHIQGFARSGIPARLMSERNVITALKASGEEFPAEVSLIRVRPGTEHAFAAILRDITALRAHEAQLGREHEFLNAVVDSVTSLVTVVARDGAIVWWNRACELATGWLREEMITTPASRLVPAGEPGHAVSRYESVLSGASLHGLPGSLATRDGRVRLVEWEARGLPDVDGATDFVVFIGNDITDRVRAEARYYELFESASDMIVTTNLEGQVDRANRAAEALTGRPREVLLGSPVFGLLAAEHRDQVREASLGLRAGGPPVVVTDLHLVTPAGERVAVEASINLLVEDGTPSGYQAIFRDVTARQAAERERLAIEMKMQDAQRLESLGVLAGGIAHDFNNLLTVIIGNVSYLKRVLAADGSQREIIEEIEGACRHAADLAQQMLAYSGKGRFVTQRIELNQLYREIAQLLHASIGAGVTLSAELVPTLPAFEGDLTQVRQVVMNLIVNASDAIGEGVGSITARTGTMQADRRYLDECLVPETLPEGEYVYLEVADTGRGMDAATVARIFDPFFTTKATGRGLGLAAVLGILRAHRGTLRVWSEQGIGTTFRVLLPLGRDDAAALQGATAYD